RLMYLGLSQAKTVLAIVAITLISGLAALVIVDASVLSTWFLLMQVIVVYSVFSFIMVFAAKRVERSG
ncbi:MAG: hypothetical protein Q9M23_07490, partial [Mariprofundaceae bacterium]|nr:hypothetical protein [Mariprofundaceae bacterium]